MDPIKIPRFAFLFLVLPLLETPLQEAFGIQSLGSKITFDMVVITLTMLALFAYNYFWLGKNPAFNFSQPDRSLSNTLKTKR